MPLKGTYYDLDTSLQNISNAFIRENGAEIAFDFDFGGYTYTVTLRRDNGPWFRGKATSRPGNDTAELSCRVYEDRSEGSALVLVGHTWKESDGQNSSWMVELENEDE